MKLISKSIATAISIAAFAALQACSGNGGNNQNITNDQLDEMQESDEMEQSTFYMLPSPEDIFAFSAEKMKYSSALLNPTDKADSYMDIKAQEINFGVYTADMAYAAAFGEYNDAGKYLKTIKGVSSKLGLESIFTQALATRVDQFLSNKDSLKSIANDTYYDIKKSLESHNRNSTIAQISAGGWVECMYIITNSIEKFSETDPNIQHIAGEKQVFTSLMQNLEQLKDKPGISATINDLKPIEEAYAQLAYEDVAPAAKPADDNEDAPIKIGGSKKLKITEDNFNFLKEKIAGVRQVLTNNK